jgi:hypothetical protein
LRIGAFHLYVEGRVIEFRLTMPIRTEADLPEQFNQAVATTLSTMDDHVRTLGLLACDTPEARQAIAKLSPATQAAGVITRLSNERFELN